MKCFKNYGFENEGFEKEGFKNHGFEKEERGRWVDAGLDPLTWFDHPDRLTVEGLTSKFQNYYP
jgi:hypothetical protein